MNPRKALNKAYLKLKPGRAQINTFKEQLQKLLRHASPQESEEFNKNLISRFLRDTYYHPDYFINTKGRNDLVIHNGKDAKSSVGVIIEAKKPGNKAEMLSTGNLNTKALQELLWYFLGERITGKNDEVKHLIVTNVTEWFIFDAQLFDKLFAQDKALVKRFEAFRDKQLSSTSTDYFYREIAAPAIEANLDKLTYTHIRMEDYAKALRPEGEDSKLIPLFKILSPEHLLRLPFVNDSNTLDKRFYSELLHIIGLSETKQGGKKLIERKTEGQRNLGSLLENTINQLDSLDKINRMEDAGQFGENYQERLFNVGLELCITWINRIMFLKLLEAQVVRYHKNDKNYSFLNIQQIPRFGDLNALFFSVLARKPEERNEYVKETFAHVPYLNSSLFEVSEVEDKTIVVSNLLNERTIPLHPQTVLKNDAGKRKSGEMNTLEYLFAFLGAYDFASEGTEDIQEENKTLINASVLGLIFEKINGYKDGSFFTPGFITMYMCRETIRRAVLQKFKETKGWDCDDLAALYNKIDDTAEANGIVNSLKICDPAVGSGHFLVSALNEIIAIKHELRIFQDRQGRRLKEYNVEVVNDELVITDEDGELFEYRPGNTESQRVQEALFHEKQAIIEGCLFGVDINPNSVKICRLRLWIELLKNAYYKEDGQLETLPNIDINIKCGNSLISRFALDADLGQALKKSKWTIDTYQTAVQAYRHAHNKEEKREMLRLINDIKNDFRTEISANDPKVVRLTRSKGELFNLTNQTQLFDRSKKEQAAWDKKLDKLTTDITKLEKEIEEIKNNKIYDNAFEWRFEFPEVLNDEGGFVGFDVVIGNPPYVFARENFDDQYKNYYYDNFKGIDYQINLYVLFAELTLNILQSKGHYSLIVPNSLLMVSSTSKIRRILFSNASITEVVNFLGESFEGVSVETVAYFGLKGEVKKSIKVSIGEFGQIKFSHYKKSTTVLNSPDLILNVFSDDSTDELLTKIKSNTEILDNLVEIKAGLQAYEVGKGNPKQSRVDVSNRIYDYDYKIDENTFPYLEGKDVQRYFQGKNSSFLKYGDNLAAPRTFDIFSSPKIIIREITGQHPHSIISCYSEDTVLFNRSNIAINQKENSSIELKYILALINSTLMSYYFQMNTAKAVRRLFPKIILKDLRQFPIKVISIAEQKPFIDLVDKIIEAKNQNYSFDTTEIENQINLMVYTLYDLTEEEIKIIENAIK